MVFLVWLQNGGLSQFLREKFVGVDFTGRKQLLAAFMWPLYLAGSLVSPFLWVLVKCFRLDTDFCTAFYSEKKEFWNDKVVWVTGASSGIGKALCELLSKRGCRLILSGRKVEALENTAQVMIERGFDRENLLILPFDISRIEFLAIIVEKAFAWKGRIDVLVNNAGLSHRKDELTWEMESDIFNVNLLAPICLTKLVLPRMEAQNSGSLVFMNSIAGRFVISSNGPYSGSKAGLLAWTEVLAGELYQNGYEINVTNIMPGLVNSNFGRRALGHSDDSNVVVPHDNGLPPMRVAEVTAIGVSNKLQECWVCKTEMVFLYLRYYFPKLWHVFYKNVSLPYLYIKKKHQ